MFFFEGSSCPVCGEPFTPADDIVTCPDCGTPHHRVCYNSTGKCAFDDLHAEGYEWSRADDPSSECTSEDKPVICPSCGCVNPAGRLYCQNCSVPLSEGGKPESDDTFSAPGSMFNINDGELIDGVPVGDVKRFVGSSWYFHIPTFLSMDRTGKTVSFNLFAFFLHGLWFISRKMYGLGIAIITLMLGLITFQTSCLEIITPLVEKMQAGDYTAIMEFTSERPLLAAAISASVLLQYAVYFICGLFANRLYMNHSIRKIKKLNARAKSADEFNSLLESKGGTSILVTLLFIIAYFGVQYIIEMYPLTWLYK